MTSLFDFPLPTPTGPGKDICEFDSIIRSSSTASSPRLWQVQQTWSQFKEPIADDSLDEEDMMVDDMPLRKRSASALMKKQSILDIWCHDGVVAVLEELARDEVDEFEERDLVNKILSLFAKALLKANCAVTNLYSKINPLITMPYDDVSDIFAECRGWKTSKIKFLASHPHAGKIAIALRDDAIQVFAPHTSSVSFLACKEQNGVTSLAWKPFDASDLAVGCQGGILVWTIDPKGCVTRPPPTSTVYLRYPGHAPVTCVQWDPRGKFLLSCSPLDTSMLMWNVSARSATPLKRVGGRGVHLVSWSPAHVHALFAATPSETFRVWETRTWTQERWSVPKGFIKTASWSPNGRYLVFCTSEEPTIYYIDFFSSSNVNNATPIADLTAVAFTSPDGKELCVGGIAQSIRWDPSGGRLVVLFEKTNFIAVYCTNLQPNLELAPIGLIQGHESEAPACMDFIRNFEGGSLLAIAWVSGRVQYVPFLYISNCGPLNLASNPIILSPELDVTVGAKPELFTDPDKDSFYRKKN